METVATCNCGSQQWKIFEGKVMCFKCGKEYKLEKDLYAVSLINLINDNY